jgi:UDP-N-acetylglucosamine 2-epimerase (non-hydrolysing)
MPKIQESNILQCIDLKPKRYFVISAHREENVDSEKNLRELLETLNALACTYDFPIIVSTHPRTRKKLDTFFCEIDIDPKIKFMKPFGFCDYINLQMNALCVLSDSGTITEEASLLNLPAIIIRNTHERPEGMDAGTLIMAGLKKSRILDSIQVILEQNNHEKSAMCSVQDYKNPLVSKQILRIVTSYTDYVNRVIWHKAL